MANTIFNNISGMNENIDTEENFNSLFNAINKMAEKYDMPILYSCHPRSKKKIEERNFTSSSKVITHEPMGFHDYNKLQMNILKIHYIPTIRNKFKAD